MMNTDIERTIVVLAADDGHNVKCPRCWHWHGAPDNFGHLPEEIKADPEKAKEALCDSCQRLILTEFPQHPSVPHIMAALAAQRRKFTGQEFNEESRKVGNP
jgi:hypothetical protein